MTRNQIVIVVGAFVACAALALCSAAAVAIGMIVAVTNATSDMTRRVEETGPSSAPPLGPGPEDSVRAARPTDPVVGPTLIPRGPTARQSPTPGPSPTLPAARMVEDWRRFADDEALGEAFSVNEGWADNEIAVELTDVLPAGTGRGLQRDRGIALKYDITAQTPNDYVGFEWDLDQDQDWRGFAELVLRIPEATGANSQLVVQFHERSGEVWRHRMTLADTNGAARIPLIPAEWEWADWSESDDLELALESVRRMGIFVGHIGPAGGRFVVGPITVTEP